MSRFNHYKKFYDDDNLDGDTRLIEETNQNQEEATLNQMEELLQAFRERDTKVKDLETKLDKMDDLMIKLFAKISILAEKSSTSEKENSSQAGKVRTNTGMVGAVWDPSEESNDEDGNGGSEKSIGSVDITTNTFNACLDRWIHREADISTVFQLEDIKNPTVKNERTLLKLFSELKNKENRTKREKEIFENSKLEKIPPPSNIKNFAHLLNYIRHTVYLKVKFLIPDIQLKNHVHQACSMIQDKEFQRVASNAIELDGEIDHPIQFGILVNYINSEIPKRETKDIVASITQELEDAENEKVALTNISIFISRYQRDIDTHISNINWIEMFRAIHSKYPLAYQLILKRISNQAIQSELESISFAVMSTHELALEIELDYEKAWVEFTKAFQKVNKLTNGKFNSKSTKKGDNKDKSHKSQVKKDGKKYSPYCNICGSSEHNYRTCPLSEKLSTKIKFKQGKYRYIHDESKEFPLERGENLIDKFKEVLEITGRH
ncbi:hypothetical protein K6H11_005808 [Candida tropicalis]